MDLSTKLKIAAVLATVVLVVTFFLPIESRF